MPGMGSWIEKQAQAFGGLEMNPLAGGNGDYFPGARVTPGARGMQHHGKGTKPGQGDFLALGQGLADDREKSLFWGRMGRGTYGTMGRMG
jgi:hypothetical protein